MYKLVNQRREVIMNKSADYKVIAYWGNRLGELSSYIKTLQQEAAADNAPLNAIYQIEDNDGWITTDDIAKNNPKLAADMEAAM
jgi:hypothetical protein